MTVDETDLGDSFTGIMKNLNLESKELTHAELHNLDYKSLAETKQNVEFQLETLFDLLRHKYNFDMELPLVVDGFPRNDVDVVTIRLIRTKIIRLRNDHKYILQLIEEHLVQQLAQNASSEAVPVARTPPKPSIPFAEVREVAEGGPAEISGLKPGDKIVLFDGDIHVGNHSKLTAIVGRVKNKVEREVPVEVLRGGERIELVLVPTDKWDGRGFLGCHIVPC